MQLVNLTPHPLNVFGLNGAVTTLAPAGKAPRLAVSREARPSFEADGNTFAVVRPTLGAVEGLPAPVKGTFFVVSALVAEAAKRPDLLSPGELVRDGAGNVIGCKGFCSYV